MTAEGRSARTAAVAAALAAAAALRFWGIGFGPYHPDEHLVINHALAFGTGDLNPHVFYFPTFFMYLVFAVYGAIYAAGVLAGRFENTGDFLDLFLRQPEVFYVSARAVSALFGVLTVWVAYRLGRAVRNPAAGTAAAFLAAAAFLHARDSHYATPDIAMTFFVALSAFFILEFLRKGRERHYYFACLAAGAGASVKYNAFFLAPTLALALLSAPAGRHPAVFLRRTFLGAAIFFGVFFALSPFVLLDFPSFLADIRWLKGVNEKFRVSAWHHGRFLLWGTGLPFFAAAVGGFFADCRRPSWKAVVFASFPLFYYAVITKFGQHFERYALPIIPFMAVWAALFLERFGGRLLPFWVASAASVSLVSSIYTGVLLSRPDTRDLARDWIAQKVPQGTPIAINNSVLSPRLVPTPDQIRSKIADAEKAGPLAGAKSLRLERLLKLEPYLSPSFTLYYLQDREGAKFSMLGPMVGYNLASLRALGIRFLVTNRLTMLSQPAFFERLREEANLSAVFDPRIDKSKEAGPFKWTTLPVDGSFWNLERPGPLLYLFELEPETPR